MDEANTLKENNKTLSDNLRTERQLTLKKDDQLLAVKEKLKTIATRSIKAFQQTDEYNTVLFSWYFKGFELLRKYLVKHPTRVDLQNLDLEKVDQEIAIDEAAQSSAPEGDAPEKAPADDAPVDDASTDDAPASDDAVIVLEFTTCERFSSLFFSLSLSLFFFFFLCPLCFGLFVNLISEQFPSNLSRELYFQPNIYGLLDIETIVTTCYFWALIKFIIAYLLAFVITHLLARDMREAFYIRLRFNDLVCTGFVAQLVSCNSHLFKGSC